MNDFMFLFFYFFDVSVFRYSGIPVFRRFGISTLRDQGQRHDETGTGGVGRVEFDVATQTSDRVACYGESDAGAIVVLVQLYKLIKDVFRLVGRNAYACVFNGKDGLTMVYRHL